MSASSYAAVSGANNRVRVAVIGTRGMGRGHIRAYAALPDVEVAAICDVDEGILARTVTDMENRGLRKPETHVDLRKLYEDKSIDAVSVATPNHWHALAGYWAVQAGKHATLEKPCTHNFFEGRQLIKASRRYGKFIQQHAERRSFAGMKSAVEFMRGGGLGEVYMAKGLCYKWRDTIGRKAPGPVPKGVNYDLWLGPAPQRDFTQNRFHYNWPGTGTTATAISAIKEPTRWTSPDGAWALNCRPGSPQSAATSCSMTTRKRPTHRCACSNSPIQRGGSDKKKLLQFEVRHWISNHEAGFGEGASNNIGDLFFGSEGYLVLKPNGDWETFMGKEREPGPTGKGGGNMWENFVDRIRDNDRSKLEGDIAEGHASCALIHMSNISYRLGRTLNFDPASQRFTGDEEANAMLTRDYRSPFVIPDKI